MSRRLQKQLQQLGERTERSVGLMRQVIEATDAQYAMLFLSDAERNRSWLGLGKLAREPYHSEAVRAVEECGYNHLLPLVNQGKYWEAREAIRREKLQQLQHLYIFSG